MPDFTTMPEGDTVVESHVAKISQFLSSQPELDLVTLVLTGSFGRGEGSVCKHEYGTVEILNDYDFVLVVGDAKPLPTRELLASWEKQCSALTGMWCVDCVAVAASRLKNLPLSQETFDLRWGGRVVAGAPDILDRIPPFVAEDIPLVQAQLLLTTRMWCFIGVKPCDVLSSRCGTEEDRRFALRQLSKALMAVGDALLMLHKLYCVKYAEKAERFRSVGGLSDADHKLVSWGYAFKLGKTEALPAGMSLREGYLQSLGLYLSVWDLVQDGIPVFKRLVVSRIVKGVRQLLRRQRLVVLRGVLLDRIQLRYLSHVLRKPAAMKVGGVLSSMLWVHCGARISKSGEFAAKVAELRLEM